MFKTPYETLIGSSVNTRKLEKEINRSIKQDPSILTENNIAAIGMAINQISTGTIPNLQWPYLLTLKDSVFLLTDVRSTLNKKGNVILAGDNKLILDTALLMSEWLSDSLVVKNQTKFAMKVFTEVIPLSISKEYNLTLDDLMDVKIITADYYNNLFDDLDNLDHQKRVMRIIASTGVRDSKRIEKVLENIPAYNDITTFCKVIAENTETVRLENFNPGILISIISHISSGTLWSIYMPAALEYPPLWIALVEQASTARGFNKTTLGIKSASLQRKNNYEEMHKYITQLSASN